MIFGNNQVKVYLACGPTDMRKSIDSLAVLVREGFHLDPFSTCLYVFCNRKRDKLKILTWDHNGDSGCTTGAGKRPSANEELKSCR